MRKSLQEISKIVLSVRTVEREFQSWIFSSMMDYNAERFSRSNWFSKTILIKKGVYIWSKRKVL